MIASIASGAANRARGGSDKPYSARARRDDGTARPSDLGPLEMRQSARAAFIFDLGRQRLSRFSGFRAVISGAAMREALARNLWGAVVNSANAERGCAHKRHYESNRDHY
jgi:hypothetical protein